MRLTIASFIVVAAAACAPATNVGSPSPSASTNYVIRLGADTVALERYTRAGSRIESSIIQRSPSTFVVNSNIEMGANGLPVSWRVEQRLASGARPNNGATATITFGTDSSTYVVTRDTGAALTRRIPVGAAIPALGSSMLTYNLAIAYARLQGRDSVDVPVIGTNGNRGTPIPIRFVTGDSIRLWYFGSPMYAKLDRDGQIRWIDGAATTNKIQGVKASTPINVQAMASAYAARDAAGAGLGAATTRDTARAQVMGAALWLDYGRPSLRGRNVWVNGVLGDTLWRTGGNAATQFRTAADLRINGQTVPAGMYTLFTHVFPGNSRYELIFNRQVGQWGTVYDPKQDLLRVPLTERTVANSAERFTMTIEPNANGGVLAMQWGTKRLEVPFTVVR